MRICQPRHFISKPGYYHDYDTIMTISINYIYYDTIMTMLLHSSLLQKVRALWRIMTKSRKNTIITPPAEPEAYDSLSSIMAIMTFQVRIYYITYVYYNTIISIIAFWTIITLVTLPSWGTIISYYDNCETLCAFLCLLSHLS